LLSMLSKAWKGTITARQHVTMILTEQGSLAVQKQSVIFITKISTQPYQFSVKYSGTIT